MKIGIHAFQAGVAEAFVPVIETLMDRGIRPVVVATEHSRDVFIRSGLEFHSEADLWESQPDVLLTGTSWVPECEQGIWQIALDKQIPVAAYIDNWCNYTGRFLDNGGCKYPDEILAIDEWMASGLVESGCPHSKIHVVGHPALERLAQQNLPSNIQRGEVNLLYVADGIYPDPLPGYQTPEEMGYSDMQLLDNLLLGVSELACQVPVTLFCRRHPACPDHTLQGVLDRHPRIKSKFVDRADKRELFAQVHAVVGGSSMILVEAAASGAPTYSVFPQDIAQPDVLTLHPNLIQVLNSANAIDYAIRTIHNEPERSRGLVRDLARECFCVGSVDNIWFRLEHLGNRLVP